MTRLSITQRSVPSSGGFAGRTGPWSKHKQPLPDIAGEICGGHVTCDDGMCALAHSAVPGVVSIGPRIRDRVSVPV
jgi:hypothetical protein